MEPTAIDRLWRVLPIPCVMLLHIGGTLGGLYLGHHGHLAGLWPSWLPENWGLAMFAVFVVPGLIGLVAYLLTLSRAGVPVVVGLIVSTLLTALSLVVILFTAIRTWGS